MGEVSAAPPYAIEVIEYDERWPADFARAAALVHRALGDRVLELAHVGSTSVPGLPAKPVIDMDLVVADPADEAAYIPDLEASGFVHTIREPWWHEHRLLKHADPVTHLHVFGPDCPEVIRHRMFRQWLLDHPDDLRLYAATKRAAATEVNARDGGGRAWTTTGSRSPSYATSTTGCSAPTGCCGDLSRRTPGCRRPTWPASPRSTTSRCAPGSRRSTSSRPRSPTGSTTSRAPSPATTSWSPSTRRQRVARSSASPTPRRTVPGRATASPARLGLPRRPGRGQGLGRRMYDDLLDLVRADGIHAVLALVAQPNPASDALHRRLRLRAPRHHA